MNLRNIKTLSVTVFLCAFCLESGTGDTIVDHMYFGFDKVATISRYSEPDYAMHLRYRRLRHALTVFLQRGDPSNGVLSDFDIKWLVCDPKVTLVAIHAARSYLTALGRFAMRLASESNGTDLADTLVHLFRDTPGPVSFPGTTEEIENRIRTECTTDIKRRAQLIYEQRVQAESLESQLSFNFDILGHVNRLFDEFDDVLSSRIGEAKRERILRKTIQEDENWKIIESSLDKVRIMLDEKSRYERAAVLTGIERTWSDLLRIWEGCDICGSDNVCNDLANAGEADAEDMVACHDEMWREGSEHVMALVELASEYDHILDRSVTAFYAIDRLKSSVYELSNNGTIRSETVLSTVAYFAMVAEALALESQGGVKGAEILHELNASLGQEVQ